MEIRRLTDADAVAVDMLLQRDPVANNFLISKFGQQRIGVADTMGAFDEGLRALVYLGGNVVPAGEDVDAVAQLGALAARRPRRTAAIVGLVSNVRPFWAEVLGAWGPAREERFDQPLLEAIAPPDVAADPRVRPARIEELDLLFGPSVAMFTEEVGVSPLLGSTEAAYRSRLSWLVRQGRVLCCTDSAGVLFKAEVTSITGQACQIQGVWVRPDARGSGVASAAMVAVVEQARRDAPRVSLYVNHYNGAARSAYRHAGFRQVGTMASVHF